MVEGHHAEEGMPAVSSWATPSLADPIYAQVARDAARLLKKKGWAQGKAVRPDGRLCVWGAACSAAPSIALGHKTMARFSAWLLPTGYGSDHAVWDWNDGNLPRDIEEKARLMMPGNCGQVQAALIQFANEIDPPKDK